MDNVGSLRSAFRAALIGVVQGVHSERSLRLELAAFSGVIAFGLGSRLSPLEWLLIVLVSALVITTELMNSALETLADALHPMASPAIARAKDMAAGAVLITVMGAIAIGGIIFIPRLLGLLALLP